MNTLTAKYITLETLNRHMFERAEFDSYMADFGKTTRDNSKMSVIEIVEDETGEVVDYAHPIVISHNGEKFYEVMFSEMESNFELDGEHFDTIFDEVETTNYPIAYQRAMR